MTQIRRRFFQIQASSRHAAPEALDCTRDALHQAGVFVTEIKHYSNKASVLQVVLKLEQWFRMQAALEEMALSVSPPEADLPGSLLVDEDGDIFGTIQLVYVNDAPDKTDIIPDVPG